MNMDIRTSLLSSSVTGVDLAETLNATASLEHSCSLKLIVAFLQLEKPVTVNTSSAFVLIK